VCNNVQAQASPAQSPPDTPPRVMLDANILIALFFRRQAYVVAQLAATGRIRAVLCDYMVAEARRMLGHAFPARAGELDGLLAGLDREWTPSPTEEEIARCAPPLRDPADRPVFTAAVQAGVDYLLTSDRALIEDSRDSALPVLSVPQLVEVLNHGDTETQRDSRRG
jgi:predicted nucleic acid-binding protein